MKVIFANRSDCMTRPGGDTTQMLLTKKHLESSYNLDIEVCLDPDELSKKECDIVHIFNLTTHEHTANIIKAVLNTNAKIVLTPIYWNYIDLITYNVLSKFLVIPPTKRMDSLKNSVLFIVNQLKRGSYRSRRFNSDVEYILKSTQLALPNSTEELQWLTSHFNLPLRSKIIPNAIECSERYAPIKDEKDKNAIIQVGLIVPSKNQLSTLLALMDMPEYPLYFVGRIGDKRYYHHLVRIAKQRGNVYFTGELKNNEVTGYYKNARVHILPSLGETTGLVSLEAFYYGCEIIVSDKKFAPVDYYQFDEIGHICDPYSIPSIKSAIYRAITEPKRSYIDVDTYFKFFSYDTVARLTYEAYQSVLADKDFN